MKNAKQEFINHTQDRQILQAIVTNDEFSLKVKEFKAVLRRDYNSEDYAAFLNQINFDYDDSFGWVELEGTIWFTDGTWSTRGEYEGVEWWEHHEMPDLNIINEEQQR